MALPQNKILKNYLEEVFIETGTEHGNGIRQVLMFDTIKEIHSIELDRYFYSQACKNFLDNKIHLHFGSSLVVLPDVLNHVGNKRSTIWLDAHDNTHVEPAPLMLELDLIKQGPYSNHIILIDDLSQIGKPGTWGRNLTLSNIQNKLLDINPDYQIQTIKSSYEFSPHKTSYILAAKVTV